MSGYTKVHSEIFTVLERCKNLIELTPFKLPSRLFVNLFLEKITPNIKKLNLSLTEDVTDDAIEILVKKCKKLSALNLRLTSITETSLDLIISYCTELEALDVTQNGLFEKLFKLAKMPKLRTLAVESQFGGVTQEDVEKLKEQIPQLTNIIQYPFENIWNSLKIGYSSNESCPGEGFWEIVQEDHPYFKQHYIGNKGCQCHMSGAIHL